MNSHTTRRPSIGLVDGQYAAIEVLDDNGNLVWYADSIDGDYEWLPNADFRPLAEIPEPRMDEPQDTWETVVSTTIAQRPLDLFVFIRTHDGTWRRCLSDGRVGPVPYDWSNLIDPRPTTPTERATGIVGGEDQ